MILKSQRSIIPACDVSSTEKFSQLIKATAGLERIEAYKVGLELAIPFGLSELVRMVREFSAAQVIYDHQKGGNDIPDLGIKFAKAVAKAKADAVILFPFGGAKTERDWIKACQDEGLGVLVGGHMTQDEFLVTEGGFIAKEGPELIYTIAAATGVRDFVVPGNKVEFVTKYRLLLEKILGIGNFTLYAPGFVKQHGVISEAGKAAGENFHGIVGSAIYGKNSIEGMREAARDFTLQLL